MDWYQVERSGVIGKDLQIQLESTIFRGPIEAIVFDRDGVHIQLQWAARFEGSGVWTYCPTFQKYTMRDRNSGNPRQLTNDRIGFDAGWPSFGDNGVIYCLEEMNLSTAIVAGFPAVQ